jgi:hypothetical protein
MFIHHYDHQSGEYISSSLATADPRNNGRWLIPAFATDVPLIERHRNTWPFFVARKHAWELRPDFRGMILYRTDNGEQTEIMFAGISMERAGVTDQPRPDADHVWHDAWVIDPVRRAERTRAAAMAEFDTRLAHAREINAGKADAHAAGLLSREETYTFLAWSAYQLELVRVIQAAGFPETAQWPDPPQPFEAACGAMLAEYEARMEKARTALDADTHADDTDSLDGPSNRRAWEAYRNALMREVDSHLLDRKVVWPDEPAPREAPETTQ